jgi:hypothetical protein
MRAALVAFCSIIALLDTHIPMAFSVYCFLTKELSSRFLFVIIICQHMREGGKGERRERDRERRRERERERERERMRGGEGEYGCDK